MIRVTEILNQKVKGATQSPLSVLNEIEPLGFYSRRSKRRKRKSNSSTSRLYYTIPYIENNLNTVTGCNSLKLKRGREISINN